MDPKSAKGHQIMGWYLRDQQLKLDGNQIYQRKDAGALSTFIDIVSKHYFSGEIYKGASAPVFLDQLEFKVPQGYQTISNNPIKNF